MFYKHLLSHLHHIPEVPAYIAADGMLTYRQLIEYSARLANHLRTLPQGPVAVFGHKQIWMPVAFLACFFSGRPYVPVNSDTPPSRLAAILSLSEACGVLAIEAVEISCPTLSLEEIQRICVTEASPIFYPSHINATQLLYILFTSGSTGRPKGIPISYSNLNAFLSQMQSWLSPCQDTVCRVMNTAPFSFDLSVADLFYSFFNGKTLYALEKEAQEDLSSLFSCLSDSGAELVVLTPTFAKYCLLDSCFCRDNFPHLNTLFFCGETLSPSTVQKLWRRFPGLRIVNAYGPTESTVAVCAVEIQPYFVSSALPVGAVSSCIQIVNNALSPVPDGEPGEIVLTGPQVSIGYLDSSAVGFFTFDGQHAFRTGDMGKIQNGLLYFHGRKDRQIKRAGHRIEPAEIEAAINQLPGISQNAVIFYNNRLCVLMVPESDEKKPDSHQMRQQLALSLPQYMLPDLFFNIKNIPFTSNGKLNYAVLTAYLEEQLYG